MSRCSADFPSAKWPAKLESASKVQAGNAKPFRFLVYRRSVHLAGREPKRASGRQASLPNRLSVVIPSGCGIVFLQKCLAVDHALNDRAGDSDYQRAHDQKRRQIGV